MPAQFLHGAEVINIDTGPRPIRTVSSSVIGLIGTAPDADPETYPLDTPVLVAGSRLRASKLGTTGTLPWAMDAIFDQVGAVVVVVRVAEEATTAATTINVLGGVDPDNGGYKGVHAFLGARTKVKVSPRILIAPGFTHQRVTDGVISVSISQGGVGYTVENTTVTITGDGRGAEGKVIAVDGSGAITAVAITKSGTGYTSATVTFTGDGTEAEATASIGNASNPIVAEMLGIADRLRAVIVADGPNTNDMAALDYRADWGSKRVYVVDPWVVVQRTAGLVTEPPSPRVAGLIARIDNTRGFWWSPSNQEIYGISGTARPIDFAFGDRNSRANYLNANEVTTIIYEDGYRLWGNRGCSSDPKWAFLCISRTGDIIADSLVRNHLWAVDRGITKTYFEDVSGGVNAYLRYLNLEGAIIGGHCWPDPDLNSPEYIVDGESYFNFDWSGTYPAEHVTFRSMLVNDYLTELL